MKVRKLNADGDMCMGHGSADYIENTPEAVAQNVMTRLSLWSGQWFIDTDEGTPYLQEILGKHDAVDLLIKQRILETPGVIQIEQFEAIFDPDTRRLSITAEIDTEYGKTTVNGDIQ